MDRSMQKPLYPTILDLRKQAVEGEKEVGKVLKSVD